MILTRSVLLAAALGAAAFSLPAITDAAQDVTPPSEVAVLRTGGATEIVLQSGAIVRRSAALVEGVRALRVPGSSMLAVVWNETDAEGATSPWYALSLDGREVAKVEPTSYEIAFARTGFDPLERTPAFAGPRLSWDGEVFLVQFHTQVLAEYREALEQRGATVYDHLVHHTLIARMTPEVRAAVEELDVVRWVGAYRPELRVEPEVLDGLADRSLAEDQAYNVMVFERGPAQKELVADRIQAMGAETWGLFPEGFRFIARLSPDQLLAVAAMPEVAGLDRWGPGEVDLNIVRQFSGTDYLEAQTGFSGQGVRGECFDTGVYTTHPDFQHDGGVLLHGPNGSSTSHGTQVTGVVFGDGTGNAQARGLLPNGKIVFGRSSDVLNGTKSRYTHTAEMVDPAGPYRCVFQTNSTGSPRTFFYNSISAEMDDILFQYNIVILQSQSNAGNQDSRPQAWAKNVVGVGGVKHQNTLSKSDDSWTFGGSIGPASDGRIKPDLAHFYDSTIAAATGGGYANFSGTSNATPCTAGHFGLFFQMWHEDVWNNGPTGATVFDSRPSARLARAAVINTATQWTFSGTSHDLTRVHQGWGAADVAKLYDTRSATFFVDETDPVDNLGSRSYNLDVQGGTPELKVTVVYRDPKAVNFSGVHRINDLSLRVTSPGGTVYWGNNGLNANMWSTAGGAENHVDVVENVFVQNPQAGTWLIEVLGSDINTDIVPGVPGNNADFALWATGGTSGCPPPFVNVLPAVADCIGAQVNQCATVSGTGPFSYQWLLNGVAVPGATQSCFTFTIAPGDSSYGVTVTGACGTDTETATLEPLSAPVVTPLPDLAGCVGTQVTECATVSGGGTVSYQWTRNGVAVPGATQSCFTFDIAPGDSSYGVTVTGACGGDSSTAAIAPDDPPALAPLAPVVECPGSPVTVCATLTSGGSPLTYQWSLNGLPVSGANSSCFTFTVAQGDTEVSVSVSNGCGFDAVSAAVQPTNLPQSYCTSKPTSSFTFPLIGWTGIASLSSNDLVVTLSGALGNKNGLVFWGAQRASTPFGGGTLCIAPPLLRGPLTKTAPGGTAAYGVTITPAMVGTTRDFQWWFRDPADPFGMGLSNALEVTFCN